MRPVFVTYLWQSCNADFIDEEMATSETNFESAPENAIPNLRKPPDKRKQSAFTFAIWIIVGFTAMAGTRAFETKSATQNKMNHHPNTLPSF